MILCRELRKRQLTLQNVGIRTPTLGEALAQRTVVQLVDDITGKEIADGEGETITFAVNGTQYSIDLDARGAKKFYDSLSFYTDHATKVGRAGAAASGGRARRRRGSEADPAAIRVWAAENGIEVSARGRISADVVERYHAAGN